MNSKETNIFYQSMINILNKEYEHNNSINNQEIEFLYCLFNTIDIAKAYSFKGKSSFFQLLTLNLHEVELKAFSLLLILFNTIMLSNLIYQEPERKLNYNCVSVFTQHTNSVNCLLQLKNRTLASGSTDKTIKLRMYSIYLDMHIKGK